MIYSSSTPISARGDKVMKKEGHVYRLETYNGKKKTYVLVPRGERILSLLPERLLAKRDLIDPLLEEAGYVPEEVPVSEPLLVEILCLEDNKVTKVRRFCD